MRLAVVTQTRSKIGGAESYLEAIIPALATRHDVAFWTERADASGRGSIELPGHVQALDSADRGASLGAWKPDLLFAHGLDNADLERQVLDIAPSVVVQHTYHGTCITSAKTMHVPGVRACGRQFGPACLALYFPRRCGGLNPFTMGRLYATQSTRLDTLRRTAGIVTLSAYMRDELLRHGLPPDRVHVVPPFVNAPTGPEPTLRVQGACELLFLGRLEPLKGVDRLIDAIPIAARRLGRPVRLTVGGDGAARRALEIRAEHVGQANPRRGLRVCRLAGRLGASCRAGQGGCPRRSEPVAGALRPGGSRGGDCGGAGRCVCDRRDSGVVDR